MTIDKKTKAQIIEEFGVNQGDTGSTQVQIALLSHDIKKLTEHMKENHKDYSTKRGLLMKVACRSSFLKYLAKSDPDAYRSIKERLGLKK